MLGSSNWCCCRHRQEDFRGVKQGPSRYTAPQYLSPRIHWLAPRRDWSPTYSKTRPREWGCSTAQDCSICRQGTPCVFSMHRPLLIAELFHRPCKPPALNWSFLKRMLHRKSTRSPQLSRITSQVKLFPTPRFLESLRGFWVLSYVVRNLFFSTYSMSSNLCAARFRHWQKAWRA